MPLEGHSFLLYSSSDSCAGEQGNDSPLTMYSVTMGFCSMVCLPTEPVNKDSVKYCEHFLDFIKDLEVSTYVAVLGQTPTSCCTT